MSQVLARTTILILFARTLPSLFGQAEPLSDTRPDPRHFVLMGLTLGASRIADVQRVIGKAPAQWCGEHLRDHIVCYRSSGKDGQDVWLTFGSSFLADGEVLDFFEVVSGVQKDDPCYDNCARASFASTLQTRGGLRLGMTSQQLTTLLGLPPKLTQQIEPPPKPNERMYFWHYLQPMTREEIQQVKSYDHPATRGATQWYITDTIRITLDGFGRVVGFYVGHSRAL